MGKCDKEAYGLKIAWFTPLLKKSAIGYYSKLACEELAKEYDVSLFTHQSEHLHETFLKIVVFEGTEVVSRLKAYDIVVYNLGDYSAYHSQIYEVACAYPGIMILHDASLFNFIAGHYLEYKKSYVDFIDVLEKNYGKSETQKVLKMISDADLAKDLFRYDFIEEVTKHALGVIVHSHFHLEKLRQHYDGPSEMIYFPYVQTKENNLSHSRGNGDYIYLLTVGNVNSNKRIAEVLKAIGKNEEIKRKVKYTIVGALDGGAYEEKLRRIINEYRLKDSVSIMGFTDDDKLVNLYEQADILINLRFPVFEGASWSLVEQMDRGKPIIVTNIGFFAEIPDDCVFKIDGDGNDEIAGIQKILIEIIGNRDEAVLRGKNAKEFLTQNFSPAFYSNQFSLFLEKAVFLLPLEDLLRQVQYEFINMKIVEGMLLPSTVSQEMANLFSMDEVK